MTIRAWAQATRPLAHANLVVPLLVGEAAGWAATQRCELGLIILAHVALCLDHLFIVFANDVADEAGDRANAHPTMFSGGSRVLVHGALARASLVRASIAAAVTLVVLAGATALVCARPLLVPLWCAAIALLIAYSYPPLRLSYRGWGEFAQGLGMGAVLPAIGFYTVTGSLHDLAWPMLVPLVLVGFAGNILTALPDYDADKLADKRTWPVRFGLPRARKHCLQLFAIAILMTPFVVPTASKPVWLAIEALPLLLLGIANWTWQTAAAADRSACVRFIIQCGLAVNVLLLSWCVAMVWLN